MISGAVTTTLGVPHTSNANSHLAVNCNYGGTSPPGRALDPFAGLLVELVELSMTLAEANGIENAVLLAALVVALAVLGPGSRSVDPKLYQRKRIPIRNDWNCFSPSLKSWPHVSRSSESVKPPFGVV